MNDKLPTVCGNCGMPVGASDYLGFCDAECCGPAMAMFWKDGTSVRLIKPYPYPLEWALLILMAPPMLIASAIKKLWLKGYRPLAKWIAWRRVKY